MAEAPLYHYSGDPCQMVLSTAVVFFMVKFSVPHMAYLGLLKVPFTEIL